MTTNNDDVFSQTISVLIVDADTESPDNTQAAFAKMGIGTDCYGNEEQALEMVRLHHARRQEYDLILVDRSLPTKQGPEVVKDIRALLGENITTVIILTDDDAAGGAADADRVGADAFMKKPLSVKTVLEKCRQIADHKKAGLVSDPALLELDGRRILIAEDMTVNAEIVKQLLSMNFMEVDHAKNGLEAVNLFLTSPKGHYDAILMDVRMPIMNGLAATMAIRASEHPDAKTVPIIAMTTNYFDEDVQLSLEAGMNAHLEKPVEPEQIFRTLADLICKNR